MRGLADLQLVGSQLHQDRRVLDFDGTRGNPVQTEAGRDLIAAHPQGLDGIQIDFVGHIVKTVGVDVGFHDKYPSYK